jgi:hypothetical protein
VPAPAGGADGADARPDAASASQEALFTRAWENVQGMALVNDAASGGSCAYLGTKDTATGIGQTLLPPTAPQPPPAAGGGRLVDFNLTALRGNASHAIWGDAFRRPFAYQPLCGFGERSASAAPAPPPAAAAAAAAAGNRTVRVALLQLSPGVSEAAMADKVHAFTMADSHGRQAAGAERVHHPVRACTTAD